MPTGELAAITLHAPNSAATVPLAIAGIRLDWEILSFDHAAIDLEALRPFLTEASILAACRKHLEENGPNTLDGVRYRQVAAR